MMRKSTMLHGQPRCTKISCGWYIDSEYRFLLLHKYGLHADVGKNESGSLLECYHTVQTLVAENEGKTMV